MVKSKKNNILEEDFIKSFKYYTIAFKESQEIIYISVLAIMYWIVRNITEMSIFNFIAVLLLVKIVVMIIFYILHRKWLKKSIAK
jgi:hypothetical protein